MSGVFAPGKRLPAERRMAAELGFSRTSIQIALRELESEGWLLRQPNCRPVVRQPQAPKTVRDQIAVSILPEVQDLGGMLMLQGIRSVLGSHRYRILLGGLPPNQSYAQAELEFLQSALASPNVAGAIVWDVYNKDCKQVYLDMVEKGISLVFIDRAPGYSLTADIVGTDNVEAARAAVRHLIGLGHVRTAIVLTDDLASTVQERLTGYRVALDQAEIPFDNSLVVDCPLEDSLPICDNCERILGELLSRPNPPTAIFAVNDQIGLHLLEAAKRLEVKIPEQLSLVGFDWLLRNLPGGGDLTTVAQPFEEIGRTAAQRLLDRIQANDFQTPRKILFDAPLVLKSSTAVLNASYSTLSPKKDYSYAKK